MADTIAMDKSNWSLPTKTKSLNTPTSVGPNMRPNMLITMRYMAVACPLNSGGTILRILLQAETVMSVTPHKERPYAMSAS